MRILVTGHNGFLGQHLLKRGVEVLIPAPYTELGNVRHELPDSDVVINLASHVDVPASMRDPHATFENNTDIAWRLIHYARETGARIIHVSSAEVFGPGGPYGPESPFKPTNPYAASKVAQDAIFGSSTACFGVDVTIARTANPFGEYQQNNKFVPVVLDRLSKGETVTLFGDASRRWIHADDVVDGLLQLAVKPSIPVAHLTGSALLKNRDFVYMLSDAMGVQAHVEVLDEQRPGHEDVYDVPPYMNPVLDNINAGIRKVVEAWKSR